jgi:hypothetical protein
MVPTVLVRSKLGMWRVMTRTGKISILFLLVFLEIVFLSLALGSHLPRRSSELEAFTRYQKAQTPQNRESWLKERQFSEREVKLRKGIGYSLAVLNLCLIIWVAKRPGGPGSIVPRR